MANRDDSAAARLGRRYGLPAVLIAAGLVAAALMVLTDWIRERLVLEDIARIHALGQIQSRVASAHLWIEEYVTGDEVALDQVYEHLARSRELAGTMLGDLPGISASGYRLTAFSEPHQLRLAAAVAAGVDEFEVLSRRRQAGYEAGEPVGIGSPADVEYDHVFQRLLGAAASLDASIGERLIDNHRRSRTLLMVVLLVWLALVTVAVLGLYRYQQRRLEAEQELKERELELFQARKLEAIGRLAGGIAHDINNYLAAITAQCERVQRAAGEGPVSARLQRVITTAFKASSLIKQLLAFTRRQPLRLRVLDLNRQVDELMPMMRRLLGEDITLRVRLAPGLWPVRMDPSQVEQVVVNLLINAREAMAEGGTVTVATANRAGAGAGEEGARVEADRVEADRVEADRVEADRVELAISDDGPGIAPEIRDKLFEPFFTTKAEHGGSGLGLSTVYGIVTGASGTVTLDSEVGAGSRFTISLPARPGDEVEAAEDSAGSRPLGGDERILLVDDNAVFRRSVRASLRELGYRVTDAGDGIEALAAFEAAGGAFDVVISDVRMPRLSGPAMADRLRRQVPDLRILFISGSGGSTILTEGFAPGEFDILDKPFAIDELDRRIRALIEQVDAMG